MRSYHDILHEMHESEDCMRAARLRRYLQSFDMYKHNFRELDELLSEHNSFGNFLNTIGPRGRERLRDMQTELLRRIQNAVVSAMSLRDHGLALKKKMKKDGKDMSGYETEVNARFAAMPVSTFLKNLRDYFVHVGIPPISTQDKNIKPENKGGPHRLIRRLKFRSDRMLASFDWKADARLYLEANTDDIDIADAVHEYDRAVRGFSEWLYGEYLRLYSVEIESCEALQREMNAIVYRDQATVVLPSLAKLPMDYTVDDVLKCFILMIPGSIETELHEQAGKPHDLATSLVAHLRLQGCDDENFLGEAHRVVREAKPTIPS